MILPILSGPWSHSVDANIGEVVELVAHSEAVGTGAGILPTVHPAPHGGPNLVLSRSEAAAAEGSLGRGKGGD